MQTPTSAFEATHLYLSDPLPGQEERVNTRLWLVAMDAEIFPLAYNDVSKMFHALDKKKIPMDWYVQEGMVHTVRGFDSSWYDATKECPLYVELTKRQQEQMGQNVRGFLVDRSKVVLIGAPVNLDDAIPPIIKDYKNKINTLRSLMRAEPSKELTFAFKREADNKQVHMSPEQLNDLLNSSAALLGGYDKLIIKNEDGTEKLDWHAIITVTGATI